MADLLTRTAVGRLETLAELGLLTIDTHFRVPPALVGCIADVFDSEYVLAGLGLGKAVDDADGEAAVEEDRVSEDPVPEAVAENPRPSVASVLQLKVMLNGSKPPIWRRALAPAGMTLNELHQVIQSLFGWLDYHRHHFQTEGSRGPIYAPVDPDGEDGFYGEPSLEESQVNVVELLPAVGSTMTYTYDLGDNWVHAIKLEKVLADDDGGQLPRCTAGRGAAPAEDSGGTWGWTNIVQAVNDPNHDEYEEYRDWLGLQPGETLDPKALDLDETNEDLTDPF